MVEIKTIKWDDKLYVGMLIKLPRHPLHIITSTHLSIMGGEINIDYYNKFYADTCIAVVEVSSTFEKMMESKIVEVSRGASLRGIKVGMIARDALEKSDAFSQQ